jgi:SagB-type dehydrogenase family enzyme
MTVARRQAIDSPFFVMLPRLIERTQVEFFDVLDSRRSTTGATLPFEGLSSLLWHSMRLRERRPGRFGIGWESRSTPSAGGLHPIRLLVLPVDGVDGGIYDDHRHALIPVDGAALELNRASIDEILGIAEGTTIQFAADAALMDACYENSSSLIWRDAGALTATMCLVATALGLAATPIGRIGSAIVQAAGLPGDFIGTGAVHVGTLFNGPATK